MKTLVPEVVRLEFQRIASAVGASEAELLRDAVFKICYGKTYVEHCANLRASVFDKEVEQQGRNRAAIGE
ncbi:hypothetical protein E8K88_11860 [Lampropedia aestuarii]|uniref:Uncharacterized protein n=2 Tax=Lampropedia aestuarii TaxID=2562762 RepID=A0A4S5BJ76_9BURK|nr:hypothetical protein E8K88_11860 [Lampropedia aestuarii]